MSIKKLTLSLAVASLSLVSVKAEDFREKLADAIRIENVLTQRKIGSQEDFVKSEWQKSTQHIITNAANEEEFQKISDEIYYAYAIIASYYHPTSDAADKLLNVNTFTEYKEQSDILINEIATTWAMHKAERTGDFTEETIKADIENFKEEAAYLQKISFRAFGKEARPDLSTLMIKSKEKKDRNDEMCSLKGLILFSR